MFSNKAQGFEHTQGPQGGAGDQGPPWGHSEVITNMLSLRMEEAQQFCVTFRRASLIGQIEVLLTTPYDGFKRALPQSEPDTFPPRGRVN